MGKIIESIQDLNDYLSGDKIECLICGKAFKMLGIHIHQSHKMSAREYKLQFNIPVRKALSVKSDIEKRALLAKERHIKGDIDIKKAVKVRNEMIKNGVYQQSYYLPKYIEQQRGQSRKENLENKIYNEDVYYEFLNRLKTRSLKDVTLDLDMPCEETITNYRSMNPEYDKKYKDIVKERRGKNLKNINYKNRVRNKIK